jgi:hypothetical protein
MLFRNNPVVIGITILLAGAFHAGKFFKEIHSTANGINYFMIPATQLEKITVSLFLSIVYYFAFALLAYFIGNLVGTGLNNLLANSHFLSADIKLFHTSPLKWVLFEDFQIRRVIFEGEKVANIPEYTSWIWLFFRIFLVTQSLFVLGGIYFKHNQIFKTILTLIVSGFAFLILWSIEMYLLIIRTESNVQLQWLPERYVAWQDMVAITSEVFCWLLIPFLWIVAYVRLTEKEI